MADCCTGTHVPPCRVRRLVPVDSVSVGKGRVAAMNLDTVRTDALAASATSNSGWLLGERRRTVAVSLAVSEAKLLLDCNPDLTPDEFAAKMRKNMKICYKRHPKVGFPWVMLAMFLAEIVIRMILQRWGKS